VIIAFACIAAFCLHVLRRWTQRLSILGALFVPFLVLSLFSEARFDGSRKLALFVWQGNWWNVTGTGGLLPGEQGTGKNLAFSSHPEEEEWRRKLRQVEQGISSSTSSGTLASSSSTVRPPIAAHPKRLPSAGVEWGGIIVTLGGLYTGVLHHRAKRRSGK
jgi:hypothetical protein